MAILRQRVETDRLLLRQFGEDDLSAFAEITSNPAVMRHLTGDALDETATWRWIASFLGHWQLRGFGYWAVEEKSSGRLVGRVGVQCPAGWLGVELGWMLHPSYWGQGYAFEAAKAGLEAVDADLGLDEVISLIRPDNKRSERLAERLGGKAGERTKVAGVDVDVYRYRLGNLR